MSDRDVLEKVARAIYEVNIEARKVPHEWLVYITGPRYEKLTTASHENYERAARAAVEVVLEEVEARIEAQVHEPNRDENGDQSFGYGLGLAAALSGLSDLTGDKE